ncbi:esterase/lipase family protein [Embleya sp. NBC_00896]|uniref:esterase/lipase family protein n=1 Tax=Embleya sp. NBC_00896 TaxID=2975961 RepID=UPI00386C8728|nr:alpha/beta fold hydrolase [Embleya sp. NBC_00896]
MVLAFSSPDRPPRAAPSAAIVRGAAREFACIAEHLARYPSGLLPMGLSAVGAIDPTDPPPIDACERLPVVLVHGLADNRSIFGALRRGLARAGCTDVHAVNHNPVGGDVQGKAALLGRHIEDVCERTGADGVHVIGHSLGGLIARYHAQRLGGDALVRTVVTLGTPHHGTRTARLLSAHPLVRQLLPDSPVIAELAEPAPGCATRFVAFWGDLDPFVLPLCSGAIDHPDLDATNVLVPGAGHVTLVAHRPVVDEITRLLSAAESVPAAVNLVTRSAA